MPLDWMSVAFLGLQIDPYPLRVSHNFQMPPGYQSVPRVFSKYFECVVSVCVCEAFASFRTFVRRNPCGVVSRR
jgi:hypothetical protein